MAAPTLTKEDARFAAVNDAHQLMIGELRKIRPQKSSNEGVVICCPFHADRTPSLGINLTHGRVGIGVWFCFGCSERGRWNKLAEKLGLKKINERTAQQITMFSGRKAKSSLLSIDDERTKAIRHWELDFLEPWPSERKWRGFPGEFISAIGAEIAVDTRRKVEVLVLPVRIGAEDVGMVKALLEKKKKQLSYVNSPGEWSKSSGLFGYDVAAALLEAGADVLFVVEGPRDALRLLYYGVPAVSVLGAAMWSDAKRDLLITLGANTIVLWMDSDGAGVKSTNVIKRNLRGYAKIKFVNSRKLLDRALVECGHKKKKLDVANCPLPLFNEVAHRYLPKAAPNRWRLALTSLPQLARA